jgi:hypothetical protein
VTYAGFWAFVLWQIGMIILTTIRVIAGLRVGRVLSKKISRLGVHCVGPTRLDSNGIISRCNGPMGNASPCPVQQQPPLSSAQTLSLAIVTDWPSSSGKPPSSNHKMLPMRVRDLGRRAWKVIRVNWHLGVTAFGGPPVHFRIVSSPVYKCSNFT